MICYFRKSLKPSIKVKMEQQDWESVDFEEMVQKTVNAETKVGLRSTTMVRNLDICCPQDYRPSNNIISKVQTQGTAAKNFSRPKKPKTKDPKSVPPGDDPAEPAKKEDKQKRFKCQQERTRELKKTPATGNNIVNAAKKKKSVTPVRLRVSTAIRKATMPATALSQKTSVGLGNLRVDD